MGKTRGRRFSHRPRRLWIFVSVGVIAVVAVAAVLVLRTPGTSSSSPSSQAKASSPGEQGMAFAKLVGKPAPNFRLFDQFGGLRQLTSFHGKGVLLTFISSRCTTICPLTAILLRRTQQLMGARASDTQLVAVNANRRYTSVADVMKWSRLHRMTHRWLFLTGPPIGPIEPVTSLSHIWSSYGVTAGGSHTTLVFLIDSTGRIRNVVPIANKSSITAEAKSLAKYMAAIEG